MAAYIAIFIGPLLGGIPLTHTPFQHKIHIFFQIHGIRKCDRNIKYSRAALGSNFEIRVVSDGPFSASSRCVHVRLIEILALDIHNTFLLGEQFSLRSIQTISYL